MLGYMHFLKNENFYETLWKILFYAGTRRENPIVLKNIFNLNAFISVCKTQSEPTFLKKLNS